MVARFTVLLVDTSTTPSSSRPRQKSLVRPGSYIRVLTEEIDFNVSYSLVVNSDLSFTAARTIKDGTYSAFVYKSGGEPEEREITIEGQKLTDRSLAGAIVSVFTTTATDGMYQVQQITIDESGIVW